MKNYKLLFSFLAAMFAFSTLYTGQVNAADCPSTQLTEAEYEDVHLSD